MKPFSAQWPTDAHAAMHARITGFDIPVNRRPQITPLNDIGLNCRARQVLDALAIAILNAVNEAEAQLRTLSHLATEDAVVDTLRYAAEHVDNDVRADALAAVDGARGQLYADKTVAEIIDEDVASRLDRDPFDAAREARSWRA